MEKVSDWDVRRVLRQLEAAEEVVRESREVLAGRGSLRTLANLNAAHSSTLSFDGGARQRVAVAVAL